MKRLAFIIIGQTLLCSSLAISLCWNIHQAQERSAAVQKSYLVGIDDGAAMYRAELLRAIIQRQIIKEAQANAQKEKL
jgi:hypothetical protein